MDREFAEQRRANEKSRAYFESFAEHRQTLTERVCQAAKTRQNARLCVLGAGNCHDLDLERVAGTFTEIHLVDFDATSVEIAIAREAKKTRARLECHAPVELSGVLERLEYWYARPPSPREIAECADLASFELAEELPGPFDVVLSACLLSELQSMVLRAVSATHPLLDTVRDIVNLVHLRSMLELVVPGGRGILATDVASEATCPREKLESAPDLDALLDDLQRAGKLFHATQPGLLSFACWNDPLLRRSLRLDTITNPWLRKNGKSKVSLVYALEFQRLA